METGSTPEFGQSKSDDSIGLASEVERLSLEINRQTEFRMELSHQLRTPLNAIMGFAELLQLKSPSDSNIEQILKAAHSMLDIINRKLTTSGTPETDSIADRGQQNIEVLYIEDDAINFILVDQVLQTRPIVKLLHATRGEAGVAMAQTHRPKLILLDLNLPDIHGSDVLRRLQEDSVTAEIPVVIISADATASQIEKLLAAGARNYLTKPFSLKQFLAVVDEILEENNGPAVFLT